MHVEGELSVQHVTAPAELQETEEIVLYGELVSGLRIGTDADGSAVNAVATANSVKIYAHSHQFKNLPLRLTDTNEDTRKVGANNNETELHLPKPVNNSNKGGGRLSGGESVS